METTTHIQVLRKTGKVLVVVGLLDIAVMIYCIVNGISYSSSLNIFAVIAGLFLLRGNLSAAGLVRWFSVFFLAGVCTLVLAWPVIQPPSLTLAQIRLNALGAVASALCLVGILWLLFWLQRELGDPLVLAAIEAGGRKVRNVRVAAAMGIALVVLLATILLFALNSESGTKAKELAQQRLGAGYQYHVTALSMSSNGRGTFVSASVVAWNGREIRTVPVEWSE